MGCDNANHPQPGKENSHENRRRFFNFASNSSGWRDKGSILPATWQTADLLHCKSIVQNN